ncbi:Actin-like ATPase [Glarea lozoyensis ATCC 20868]|uniref:Actin-like ATPase n=1 Tax=Glarea lozoyensis (strain ATCC 20868 / MF5171) TaxID=1116229 RepID=S3CE89_GLAL2|nr:Actin-like ATPase [Glarea lozoyensis ATCC 20868]EPE24777.1 Actin-like ATPase [Glarea lozoyensis ATCC 20868]
MDVDNVRLQELNNLLKTLKVNDQVEPHTLIISIDLGTSYSGIGYILSTEPDRVHILDQWPGHTVVKVKSPKVPTVIKYGTGGCGFSWGHQVGLRDEKKLEAFKLLLDPSLPTPEYAQINKVRKNFQEFIKTPINAVDDFMGALYRYAIEEIAEKHPDEFSVIRAMKFVISTPAGWPVTAKNAILKAARDAGASPITHIQEAEAAAFFNMRSKEAKALKLKIGDTIMICDAGGATINLTTYTIKRLVPLQVVETVPPLSKDSLICEHRKQVKEDPNKLSAKAGGSLNLNKNFENHIVRSLLEEEEIIPLKKSFHYIETLNRFDQEIKPAFSNSSTGNFEVKLEGTKLTDYPDGNLKDNTMSLDRRALEVIFQPVANMVFVSMTEQINAVKVKKVSIRSGDMTSVDAVILTGGFGSNKFLREYLGGKFPSMKFIQLANTGSALSQAPLKKTIVAPEVDSSGTSSNRKASKNYGIACCPIWNEDTHRTEKKYWDDWEGVWRCKSINWIIIKGNDLRKSKKISMPCYKQCGPNPESDEFFIVACLEQSTASSPPESSTHHSIRTNKKIKVPLDNIPEDDFRKRKRSSDRQVYWELAYDVVLEVSKGKIAFWIQIDGQQFGRVTID